MTLFRDRDFKLYSLSQTLSGRENKLKSSYRVNKKCMNDVLPACLSLKCGPSQSKYAFALHFPAVDSHKNKMFESFVNTPT